MERKVYSAGAVKWAFWFMEFKKTVNLLNEGMTLDDIRKKNSKENLFVASSGTRGAMIMNTVSARIKSMPESFISLFVNSDVSTQKLYCLTGCMCHDTLFFEFVYEVVREKMILGSNTFTDSDIRSFFADKQQQSEKVAKWTDQTLYRLGFSYKNFLYEAGITDNGKTERQIFRPVLFPEIEDWMKDNGLTLIWKALEGVV